MERNFTRILRRDVTPGLRRASTVKPDTGPRRVSHVFMIKEDL